MKKILLFLLLIVGFSAVRAFDFSAVSPSGHTLYYVINGSSAIVTCPGATAQPYPSGYDRPTDSLVIPNMVSCEGVDYQVTGISNNAFYLCVGLTSVFVPSSVQSIGRGAFGRCVQLSNLVLSDGLVSISDSAFHHCSSLINVTLPNSLQDIGAYAFYACSDLQNVTFGDSLSSIGEWAFADCYHLLSSSIPESVTRIENGTFCYCKRMTHLDLPETLSYIGERAFSNCYALDSVIIPVSVSAIGDAAFLYMTNLVHLTYNAEHCVSIGDNPGVYNVVFDGCNNLRSLTIGRDVKRVPGRAFASMAYLQTVYFNADSCLAMGSDSTAVFGGGSNLKSVVVGSNVTRIPDYAFSHCEGLTQLVVPENVRYIGEKSFVGLPSFNTITCLGMNPPVFLDSVHAGLRRNVHVLVSCGAESVYRSDSNWAYFTNIQEFNGYNLQVYSSDLDAGKVEVVSAPGCEEASAVIRAIPFDLYDFSHWNDGDTTNPRTLTVTSDTVFTAYFILTGTRHDTTQSIQPVVSVNYNMSSENGYIVIDGAAGEKVVILDVLGRVVVNSRAGEFAKFGMPAKGVYLVRVGNSPYSKIIVS